MSIVVTGATGHLGRLVIEGLLEQGPGRPDRRRRPRQGEGRRPRRPRRRRSRSPTTTPPRPSTAPSRRRPGAADLRQRGRRGASAQHTAVIDAAKAAGRRAARVHRRSSAAPRPTSTWPPSTRSPSRRSSTPVCRTPSCATAGTHENYTENLAPVLEHGAVVARPPARAGSPRPRAPTTRPPRWRC